MSNSSRIEQATRQHVGAILTAKMIQELVKATYPEDTKGVYPSDSAWKRNAEGVLECRGRAAYGDAILEYLAANSFKVLGDAEIIRMPRKRVAKVVATPEGVGNSDYADLARQIMGRHTPPEVPAAQVVATPEPAQKKSKLKKKAKAKKQAA